MSKSGWKKLLSKNTYLPHHAKLHILPTSNAACQNRILWYHFKLNPRCCSTLSRTEYGADNMHNDRTITGQVQDNYRPKQKRNAWKTDKTFFERICTGHVRHTSGSPVACQVVVRLRVRSTGHQRMRTDKYRTRNARVPTKTHAQRTTKRTTSGRLCPVDRVRSKFCACTKLSAGLNGPRLTRNAFAERETDKKRMRTETNGVKIVVFRRTSVNAIRQGVTAALLVQTFLTSWPPSLFGQ